MVTVTVTAREREMLMGMTRDWELDRE